MKQKNSFKNLNIIITLCILCVIFLCVCFLVSATHMSVCRCLGVWVSRCVYRCPGKATCYHLPSQYKSINFYLYNISIFSQKNVSSHFSNKLYMTWHSPNFSAPFLDTQLVDTISPSHFFQSLILPVRPAGLRARRSVGLGPVAHSCTYIYKYTYIFTFISSYRVSYVNCPKFLTSYKRIE